jgi:hypothetical protein
MANAKPQQFIDSFFVRICPSSSYFNNSLSINQIKYNTKRGMKEVEQINIILKKRMEVEKNI